MSVLLPLCSGYALPGHKCELVAIPVVTPYSISLHSSLSFSPLVWFLLLWGAGSAVPDSRQAPEWHQRESESTFEFGRERENTALGSKKLMCHLTNLITAHSKLILLSVAGRSSSISLLPVLEPLPPNPL